MSLVFYRDFERNVTVYTIVAVFIVGACYNCLVFFACKWMYSNVHWLGKKCSVPTAAAGTNRNWLVCVGGDTAKRICENDGSSEDDTLEQCLFWEDVFVMNLKVNRFVFGDVVTLEDNNSFLTMKVHDFATVMPSTMLALQTCQFAFVCWICVVFFRTLLVQVRDT